MPEECPYQEEYYKIEVEDKEVKDCFYFRKKDGRLELIAKNNTEEFSLFPPKCISDYKFIQESDEKYIFILKVRENEEDSFFIKIEENADLTVPKESEAHSRFKRVKIEDYRNIEKTLDKKDVLNHIYIKGQD